MCLMIFSQMIAAFDMMQVSVISPKAMNIVMIRFNCVRFNMTAADAKSGELDIRSL